METQLQLTVAKLELKQLEVIDKLSIKENDYIIRFISSSVTDKFVAINGDWSMVTGFDEECCIGKSWEDIVPTEEIPNVLEHIALIKKGTQIFDTFESNILRKDGKILNVTWKGKFFPEINGLIFIGRVKKGKK